MQRHLLLIFQEKKKSLFAPIFFSITLFGRQTMPRGVPLFPYYPGDRFRRQKNYNTINQQATLHGVNRCPRSEKSRPQALRWWTPSRSNQDCLCRWRDGRSTRRKLAGHPHLRSRIVAAKTRVDIFYFFRHGGTIVPARYWLLSWQWFTKEVLLFPVYRCLGRGICHGRISSPWQPDRGRR